jgi:hypothetical protein
MLIWISLLVPVLSAIIMLVWFRRYLAWWEVIIPIVVSLLFTLIFKFAIEKVQTADTEYWSALGQRAEYYEYWSTWVDRTCSRTSCTGSGSNRTCTTYYYDCSYCDENGPRYYLINDIGEKFSISKNKYEELMLRWKSKPKFIELNRDIKTHLECGEDGDKYEIYWNKEPLTSEPTVSGHYYENRIQAAHSAFDFVDVTEQDIKEYSLFEYPRIDHYTQETVLGEEKIEWLSPQEKATGEKLMSYCSGYWGPKVHGKIFVLLFKDQPQAAALLQESFWDGGNDNDLVICVGLKSSSRKTEWVKVFSWTSKRTLLVNLREDIMNAGDFSFDSIKSALDKNMGEYERKDFEEFNYITVDPPDWALWVTFIITILISFGLCYWAIVNDFVTEDHDVKDFFREFSATYLEFFKNSKDKAIQFFQKINPFK